MENWALCCATSAMETRTGLTCYTDSVAWYQGVGLARNRESLAAQARPLDSPPDRTLTAPVRTAPAPDLLPASFLHSRSRS
jgi:hypothetical protein